MDQPSAPMPSVPFEEDKPKPARKKRKPRVPAWTRLAKEHGVTFGYHKDRKILYGQSGKTVPKDILNIIWDGYRDSE